MNYNFIKLVCIVALLFFFNSYSFAQKNDETVTDSSTTQVDDSVDDDEYAQGDTLVTKMLFEDDNDSILKWKQSREFAYMGYLDSLLKKQKGLKKDTLNIENGNASRSRSGDVSASTSGSNSFLNSFPLRLFFWVVAIFFIGFILYKLFFAAGLFSKTSVRVEEPGNEAPESLDDYDAYNILIREAEAKNDFNLSVRYLYLQSLKKLSDNELIVFSPDKTNNLYVHELAGRNYQQDFSYLTLNYEYLWYGRFAIDKQKYQGLKNDFISFNKKI